MKDSVIELSNQLEISIILILKKMVKKLDFEIDEHTNLLDLNLDSMNAMMFLSELEKDMKIPFSVNLEPNIIYMYPTVRELAEHISNCIRMEQ